MLFIHEVSLVCNFQFTFPFACKLQLHAARIWIGATWKGSGVILFPLHIFCKSELRSLCCCSLERKGDQKK